MASLKASVSINSRSTARPIAAPASPRCAPRNLVMPLAKKGSDINPFRDDSSPSSSSSSSTASPTTPKKNELEDSVERLERAVKGRRGKKMEIRGVNDRTQEEKDEIDNPYSVWKEGDLFPQGWENMTIATKLAELYLGRRGVLFWANKSAYASVFIMLFTWVCFRFVGPALGVYKLAGDQLPPPV